MAINPLGLFVAALPPTLTPVLAFRLLQESTRLERWTAQWRAWWQTATPEFAFLLDLPFGVAALALLGEHVRRRWASRRVASRWRVTSALDGVRAAGGAGLQAFLGARDGVRRRARAAVAVPGAVPPPASGRRFFSVGFTTCAYGNSDASLGSTTPRLSAQG